MKKTIVLCFAILIAIAAFTACAETADEPSATAAAQTQDMVEDITQDTPEDVSEDEEKVLELPDLDVFEEETDYEIALITDVGGIDDNEVNDNMFNQGTWEGMADFGETNGIICKYFELMETSVEAVYQCG